MAERPQRRCSQCSRPTRNKGGKCDGCKAATKGVANHKPGYYVVCGQPGSGKTTWVAKRAQPGDLVWDLDKVSEAIAMMKLYPRPEHIKDVLLEMRNTFMAWVKRTKPACSVFVIIAMPTVAQVMAREIDAAVVQLGETTWGMTKEERRAYEQTPERRENNRFTSSKRWRDFRRTMLATEPRCVLCMNETPESVQPARQLHHIKPRKTHPDFTYTPENVVGLCNMHHGRVESAIRRGETIDVKAMVTCSYGDTRIGF